MFCTKCGAQNSIEAIYCQKCGTLLEAEEQQTRIARPVKIEKIEQPDAEDTERKIFTVSPTLTFVKISYALAALGGLLLVALFSTVSQISGLFSVLAGLSLLLIPAFYHLKQKTIRYTLTDAKIEIDEGLLGKTTRSIPLRTIQDVTVAATVPQRLLGFGNLIIDNASETGGKVILRNIDAPKKHAEVLLKQMRRLNK